MVCCGLQCRVYAPTQNKSSKKFVNWNVEIQMCLCAPSLKLVTILVKINLLYFIRWVRLYLQLFVGMIISYLRHICFVCVYSGVQKICCCVFVLFIFVLCLVFPMLPVSMDCPFLIFFFGIL